ncbi:MAG: primosomal protein N', partial [Proteobacteria bacterium]|nr:primosomal protein N' [Pseudomonadota bacterium]
MEESPASSRVRVALPMRLGPYDYAVPDGMTLAPGDFVRVPLGPRVEIGVVWDEAADPDFDAAKLKPVRARLPVVPMREPLRRFVDWVARYTMAPVGNVLRMAMSVSAAFEPPKTRRALALSDSAPDPHLDEPGVLTPARRRVLLEAMAGARPASELAEAAGVGTSVVKALVDKGWLEAIELPPEAPPIPDGTGKLAPLNPDQRIAADQLLEKLTEGFSTTLIDGVTGSGKTEVYFEAVAAAVASGKQVLVMLPEIAMSAQWLARFEQRFGVPPTPWHSELPGHLRAKIWRQIASGEARVVIGARSALFLPYRDLGLIVIDEEHEQAFKQEDGTIYHARDMAVVRARLSSAACVLASATPSLESTINAETGRYAAVHLPARHGGADLPDVALVDLRRTPPERGRFLSPPLVE